MSEEENGLEIRVSLEGITGCDHETIAEIVRDELKAAIRSRIRSRLKSNKKLDRAADKAISLTIQGMVEKLGL